MSTQQPEALRLAEALDVDATNGDMGRKPDQKCHKRQAAAELRRLFELAQEQHTEIYGLRLEVRNLNSVNADLLASLQAVTTAVDAVAYGAALHQSRAAIDKATGVA
jgi:hypothetical protein